MILDKKEIFNRCLTVFESVKSTRAEAGEAEGGFGRRSDVEGIARRMVQPLQRKGTVKRQTQPLAPSVKTWMPPQTVTD